MIPASHDTREGWLMAAAEGLRPMFMDAGLIIPETIRYAVAFPSKGARSKTIGECWQPEASEDGYHTIIIRADQAGPVDVLEILTHELVHACLPAGAKHGAKFKRAALAVGLEGEMTATHAGRELVARLEEVADATGTFPHARLDFGMSEKKTQTTRMLKAACDCGYMVRLTKKWAEVGLPDCPVGHGPLVCEDLEAEEQE